MINYSKRLGGESLFDKMFPTSPGRVDPSTGMFVTTTNIPIDELRRIASDRGSRDRGYEDRGRGYEDRGHREDRGPGEFRPTETAFSKMKSSFQSRPRPGMSGPYMTVETGPLQNPAIWLILGTGILIALEVSGVTHMSPKA